MKPDLVIGIDSSTTACKAIAFDRKGRLVAEGRASIPISNPRMGWFEQDVAHWTQAQTTALKQLTKKISKDRIAALAISNQRESFAQFDEKGKALRPGTLWLDERAHVEVREIAAEVGRERVHQISGLPSDVTPCLYRCRWLSKNEPKIWNRTAKTAEVHGILAHELTGQWKTSVASASPMGILDAKTYDWSDELLKAGRLTRAQLPELVPSGGFIGEVTAEAAKRTGLKAGTPVIAGGGDGQCASVGANTFIKGRFYYNLGTAAVGGSYGANYAIDPAFRSLVAVAEQGFSYETAIRTGTYLVTWLVERIFGENPAKNPKIFHELEAAAKSVPIGSRGLVMLPYFSGIMTPYWDTDGRGIFAGLSGSHTRGDLYRAMMEGLALEQAMMTNRAAAATSPIDHFAIVGGGSKSDLWCQIVADAAGRDVKRLETAEASALGAAMAAAKGAGWFKTMPEASAAMSGKPSKTFRPRTKETKVYAELLSIYEELWPKVSGWNARLQEFARRQSA
ncbi:MAG: xylulose kinase [Proteobacteria bacterium]|nr:xylulose kinase [Pseudomonadota bacterium]